MAEIVDYSAIFPYYFQRRAVFPELICNYRPISAENLRRTSIIPLFSLNIMIDRMASRGIITEITLE
jgi:hypothetical protein